MRDFILIVKGSGGGGLGDRIRSAIVGIIYAKLSNRKIYIDWSDGVYGDKGNNIFYLLFDVKSGITDSNGVEWSGSTLNPIPFV